MTMLWQRLFFKELLKIFFLFLGSFYFLYVLIDLSAHSKTFQEGVPLSEIAFYYLIQFAKRADLLIPFALLLSTMKVLIQANLRNELVALLTGGISMKRLLTPFFMAALLGMGFLYLNFQWLQPTALEKLATFEDRFMKEKGSEKHTFPVHSLKLEDGSVLIYQSFDPLHKAFFDVYWLKSGEDLYRIKTLFPYDAPPKALFVDHLRRNAQGEIAKIESFKEMRLPKMSFEGKSLEVATRSPKWQSLSTLFQCIPWKKNSLGSSKMNDQEAALFSTFLYKLLVPMTCLMAILGPAPFCMRFSRNLPAFFIYALGIFGMISFLTVAHAAMILGESQVLPPLIVLSSPFLFVAFIVGLKYAKL